MVGVELIKYFQLNYATFSCVSRWWEVDFNQQTLNLNLKQKISFQNNIVFNK